MDDSKSDSGLVNESLTHRKITRQVNAYRDMEKDKQMLGRSNNRLKNDIDQLNTQQVSNLYSIKRDQHVLKKEMEFVRNNSGYYKTALGTKNPKESKQNRGESRKFRVTSNNPRKTTKARVHNRESSKLPSLAKQQPQTQGHTRAASEPIAVSVSFEEEDVFKPITNDKEETQNSSRNSFDKQGTLTELKRIASKDSIQLPRTKTLSKSEQTLQGPWCADINEVRTNINNRLSTSMSELSTEKTNSPGLEDLDLNPFMYAHPDGTPRTMFTMPSFQDRFQEAMRARYIRKPGTKLDPIDKELNMDEIFDKSKR